MLLARLCPSIMAINFKNRPVSLSWNEHVASKQITDLIQAL